MARKKEQQPQSGAAEQSPRPAPQTYTREELLANAEALFAVKPEVVAGALHGFRNDRLTIDETERKIRQFQQRKVLL